MAAFGARAKSRRTILGGVGLLGIYEAWIAKGRPVTTGRVCDDLAKTFYISLPSARRAAYR